MAMHMELATELPSVDAQCVCVLCAIHAIHASRNACCTCKVPAVDDA